MSQKAKQICRIFCVQSWFVPGVAHDILSRTILIIHGSGLIPGLSSGPRPGNAQTGQNARIGPNHPRGSTIFKPHASASAYQNECTP